MRRPGSWQRLACNCLFASSLLAGSGCLGFLHPLPAPLPLLECRSNKPADVGKQHVYVFLINGMDVLDCGDLAGLRDYLHDLGFNKVYHGQFYHARYFCQELGRIHRQEPRAQVVLVGFGLGADTARWMARRAHLEGIAIDLLVCLDSGTLSDLPAIESMNAGRVVNIMARGCLWEGAWLNGAENIYEEDARHFSMASHPRTLQVLTQELTELASAIPVVDAAARLLPGLDDEPTPRTEVPNIRSAVRTDWDFLKPVGSLPQLPAQRPDVDRVVFREE